MWSSRVAKQEGVQKAAESSVDSAVEVAGS